MSEFNSYSWSKQYPYSGSLSATDMTWLCKSCDLSKRVFLKDTLTQCTKDGGRSIYVFLKDTLTQCTTDGGRSICWDKTIWVKYQISYVWKTWINRKLQIAITPWRLCFCIFNFFFILVSKKQKKTELSPNGDTSENIQLQEICSDAVSPAALFPMTSTKLRKNAQLNAASFPFDTVIKLVSLIVANGQRPAKHAKTCKRILLDTIRSNGVSTH